MSTSWRMVRVSLVLACLVGICWAKGGHAQGTGTETSAAAPMNPETTTTAAAPAPETPAVSPPATQADVAAAKNAANMNANNAWMLTSSALVLFMTAPGLAMFYGGLVRKKNVLSVIMQCLFLMGMMSVVWAIYGYTLSFGGDNTAADAPAYTKYIGTTDNLMLKGVTPEWDEATKSRKTFNFSGGGIDLIPMPTHMLFQMMFFIITPALICGAFAERMKFSAMVLFSLLWGTLIYTPLCHAVWDTGILAWGSPNAIQGGALDFAGGTVVHISSGVSALVCALVIGKRVGYGIKPMPPHNLTYTALGAAMLWVGWFGFNGGSELASDDIAASAFAATHFSAAAATLSWAGMEWILRGKPSVLGAASGAVAGLVCITPASGFVDPMSAILMGLAAGVVCFIACTSLKNSFGYDDSLDVFGVHGVGGTLGAILTGVFATRAVNDWGLYLHDSGLKDVQPGSPLGILDGNYSLIVGQITATVITWIVAIVGSFILLKVLDMTVGLRVSEQEEQQGLDVSQHGEEGYIFQ
ncbi:MAG: ammonium transporter [Pirellulales bacterium]|nr:ammonium transporter [Pirellulales bacterium]